MADTPKVNLLENISNKINQNDVDFSSRLKLIEFSKVNIDQAEKIVDDVVANKSQASQSAVHHSSKIKKFLDSSIQKRSSVNNDVDTTLKQVLVDEVNKNSMSFKQRITNSPYKPNNMLFSKKNSWSTPRINLIQNRNEIKTSNRDLLSYHAKSLQGVKPNTSRSPARNLNRGNSKNVIFNTYFDIKLLSIETKERCW